MQPFQGIAHSLAHSLAPLAGAQPPGLAQLNGVVHRLTVLVVLVLASLATLFLTLGGARYLSAGGDPSEVERAKGALKNAAIGYGLAVLAPALFAMLKYVLGQ